MTKERKVSIPKNQPIEVERENQQIPVIITGKGVNKKEVEKHLKVNLTEPVESGWIRKTTEEVSVTDFTKTITPMSNSQALVSIRPQRSGKYRLVARWVAGI